MNTNENHKRRPNPRQNANFLSAATFWYTLPTFFEGYKKEFAENDVYETVDEYHSKILGDKIENLWKKEMVKAHESKRSPSIRKVLFKAFGFEYFMTGLILAILELLVKPAQALIFCRLILFYMHDKDAIPQSPKSQLYLYATAFCIFSILSVVLLHPYMVNAQCVGLKVKIACCSLIYRKALKLNNAAFSKTNIGQMVNLLSNDVGVFIRCSLIIHYLWVGPIQCLIVTYLLYQEVGLSSILGVVLLLLCIPIYFFLGKIGSRYRLKTMVRTDERVRFLNEIISGIQLIKMYAWERPIEEIVNSLRKSELKYIKLASTIKAIYLSLSVLMIPIVLYVTIIVFIINNEITADKVFGLTIFYNFLRSCMAVFIPQGLGLAAETLISLDRINKFLLNSEIKLSSTNHGSNNVAVKLNDGTARWKTEITLNDINLTVKRGTLIAVIGPVGCGKSSLLNVILNELPLESGTIEINGKISYACQDPWLFGATIRDNILFGEEMDNSRYNEVVRRCALECDFKILPCGDNTLVGGQGGSLSGGQKARINLARAVYRDCDIYLLDDPFSAVDSRVGKHIFQDCIKDFLKDKTVILVTHQLNYLSDADEVIVLENGVIQSRRKWKENDILRSSIVEENFNNEVDSGYKTSKEIDKVVKEQQSVGSVSKTIYKTYVSLGGNCAFVSFIIFLVILTQALISSGAYFLSQWVNLAQIQSTFERNSEVVTNNITGNFTKTLNFEKGYSKEIYIYIYSIITATCIMVTCMRSYVFYCLCLKSSEKLFNNMFKSVIQATIHFFNTNSQGRILNRFSKDMGIVDNILPADTINSAQLLLTAFAAFLLVVIVNYWLMFPTILLGIALYYLKEFCLRTTQSIRRLEGISHSYVFEHLSSSLQGLNTIRAFQSEDILKKEFDCHQDLHSCCYHLYITTSHSFGYYLDLILFIYVVIVVFSFVVFNNKTLGGDIGLAITQCVGVTSLLQWAIRQATEVQNNMISVERIVEYNNIEHEVESDIKPSKSWPETGEIIFRDVYLKYSPESTSVLKNLNFRIAPNEKIGIAGRTGAGKTSIVNALFRLNYLFGNIFIDNVDITTLNLQELRSKMSIIPQDPVLFSGTLRENLDPFEELDDSDLWNVLDEVRLKNEVTALPTGLDTRINQSGKNLSVGQRQLICLARAILRNNKLLVLDEATANVDSETDALIQKTIRKKFQNCTVLTIAHRLDTVMDSDKILVMDAGEVVEFDAPSVLLQNANGHFYQMVQEAPKVNRSGV